MKSDSNILLVNLGSPSSLDIADIRKYLSQFLSDDSVIDLPKPLQQTLLRTFILPFRPKYTKAAYEKIWTPEGSPLVVNTQKIANALHEKTGWNVDIAMRYQQPSIEKALEKISKEGCRKMVIVPLYPHNAAATIGSTKKEIQRIVTKLNPKFSISFVKPFFDNDAYIDALASSLEPHIYHDMDTLLFSYHGLPERHLLKADPTGSHCMTMKHCCTGNADVARTCYRANVLKTASLTAQKLKLSNDKWTVSFQSRVSLIGPKWLNPYTSYQLKHFPESGLRRLVVVCPSFICDCLETLFEIDIEGRRIFEQAGGKSFTFVPSLNDRPVFINCLEKLILNTHT